MPRMRAEHTPTCEEYSDHHDERNHQRRDADGHKLRGCLGNPEPRPGGETTKNPQSLETSDAGNVISQFICLCASLLADPPQDNEAGQKYDQRHPKVDVLQDRRPPPPRLFVVIAIWHQSLSLLNLPVFQGSRPTKLGLPHTILYFSSQESLDKYIPQCQRPKRLG